MSSADVNWLNKPYREMSDDELKRANGEWAARVEDAGGWASAHFAAKQLEAVCREAARRGISMINPYPIRHG